MSGKDGNADKEVPSSSRKTPLLGARGLYIKSGRKVASLCKLMRVGVFPVHQRRSNWVLQNHSQSNHNKPKEDITWSLKECKENQGNCLMGSLKQMAICEFSELIT